MGILGPQSEDVQNEADPAVDQPEAVMRKAEDKTPKVAQAQANEPRETKESDESAILAIKAGLQLPDALKQIFLSPFSDQEKIEFSRVFKAMRDNPEGGKLFEKNIGGNINFVAYKGESRFGGEIIFRIMDGEEVKAQINFRPGEGKVLDMVHREVQSQALGISGSSLLVKIDEYFKVLEASKALSPDIAFSLEAGQVSVAQWVLKNGYAFKDPEQEQLFHAIVSGQKNDEYIVTDFGEGKFFDSYIFRRDVYNSYREDMNKDPTLAKKYSVRFALFKKLIPVAEEIKN